MRSGIHPVYNVAKVLCACGNQFTTRSTRGEIKIEICSNCHPFFTGKQRLLDTAGRVEKFQKRYAATGGKMVVAEKKAAAPAPKAKLPAISTKTKTLSSTVTAAPAKGPAKPGKGPKKA